jgi:hypothetical protein
MKVSVAIGFGIALLGTASAQPPDPRDQVPPDVAPFFTSIKGSETPALIPKIDYVRAVLDRIGEVPLAGADKSVGAQFQAAGGEAKRRGTERAVSVGTNRCKRVSADAPQTGIEHAKAIQEADNQSDAELIALYDAHVARLSQPGQAALASFIAQRVLPTMTSLKIDGVGLATKFPAEAAAHFAQLCAAGFKPGAGNLTQITPNTPNGNGASFGTSVSR